MKQKSVLIAAGVAAALVASYAGTAWWAGKSAEATLARQSEWLSSLPYLVITERTYQRGWFSSTESATVRLNPLLVKKLVDASGKPLPKLEVRYVQRIQHGPLPLLFSGNLMPYKAVVTTEFKFAPDTEKLLKRFFGDATPLQLENRIAFSDHGQLRLDVPSFEYEEALAGLKINWRGLKASVSYDDQFDAVSLDAHTAGLSATLRDQGELQVGELKARFDHHRDKSGVMLGTSSTELAGLTLKLGGDYAMQLEAGPLSYKGELSASGDYVNGTAELKLASLKVNDVKYGPARLETEAKHLHAPTLAKLGDEVTRLQRELGDDQALTDALVKLAREHGTPLLEHDPELAIKELRVKVPDGDIHFAGAIKLKGVVATDLDDPSRFIRKVNAHAEFDVPRPVVEQLASWQAKMMFGGADSNIAPADLDFLVSQFVEGQLQRLASKNLIRIDDNLLSARATLNAGRFVLNGRTVPLPWDAPAADASGPADANESEQETY
ncbi:YdgA family protein [Chitinibacteraceae bacterium HSL-7]